MSGCKNKHISNQIVMYYNGGKKAILWGKKSCLFTLQT